MNKQIKKVIKQATAMANRQNALGFTKNGKKMTTDQALELIAAMEGFRNWHAYRAHMESCDEVALELGAPNESGCDYVLRDGHRGVWIDIDKSFSVHVYKPNGDEGVIADIHGYRCYENTVSSAFAFYSDAEEEVCTDLQVELDEVAEWVGLHYGRNFDQEEPATRIDWIRRYAESHAEAESAEEEWVIYSPNEAALSDDDGGFWCNGFEGFIGWGHRESASVFTSAQKAKLEHLPISTGQDARWVEVADAPVPAAEKQCCIGCGLPTMVDDDGRCNSCHDETEATGAIRNEYQRSGHQASDLEFAINRLKTEHHDLFENEDAMTEFLLSND